MKERTTVRKVLERVATLPTQHEQHEYLSEAVKEDERYVEDQSNNPDSLLLKLNEVHKKGELEWFSLPNNLIPATADRGSGMGGSGYSAPVGRVSRRSPSTAKGYERPAWEEVEKRVGFIGSLDRKIECLENFLACDREHIDESLLAGLEAEQESGHVPFRVKLRLGLTYLRACEKEGIPPLLKVSTIMRDPHDAFLPSSTSEEVCTASVALAEKVRNRIYREAAREALQELRQKHEKKQSTSAWWHELNQLRRKASDIFCGEALQELSAEDAKKHEGFRQSFVKQTPSGKDKRVPGKWEKALAKLDSLDTPCEQLKYLRSEINSLSGSPSEHVQTKLVALEKACRDHAQDRFEKIEQVALQKPTAEARAKHLLREYRRVKGDVAKEGAHGVYLRKLGSAIKEASRLWLSEVKEIARGKPTKNDRINYLRRELLDTRHEGLSDEGLCCPLVNGIQEEIKFWENYLPTEEEKEAGAELKGSATSWRHLARAAVILEEYSDLKTFDDFHDAASQMQDKIGPPASESENPGETIKAGVIRLRQAYANEEGTPPRYHRMDGFRDLVFDLLKGANVSIRVVPVEQNSRTVE